MRSHIITSGLAIALAFSGPIVPVIGQTIDRTIAQVEKTSELDRAIAEGRRLFKEGSAESLRKAIGQFEKALELARSSKSQDKQALSLLALGRLHELLGEMSNALNYYNQSLPLYRAVDNQSGEAMTLANIGNIYFALSEKQKALEYFNQVLPLLVAVSASPEKRRLHRIGEAAIFYNIRNIYDTLGEKQKALEYYNQSLPIIRAVSDRSGEAAALNNVGSIYYALGQKQQALEYYNQALQLLRSVGDRGGEAATLNNIGNVYDALDKKKEALEYYNQALLLLRAVGNRSGEATTLNNVGRVYNELGATQKALEYYAQSLPIFRAVGDRGSETITLNNIGRLYDVLGEEQNALKFYTLALPLARAVGSRSGEANTLDHIGLLLYSKQPDTAIVFYKQSVNLYESIRKEIRKLPRETQETYAKSVSDTYRRLADALLAQGRIGEAQKVMELLKIQELNTLTEGTRSPIPESQVALNQLEQEIVTKYTSLVDFGKLLYDCEQSKCSRYSEYNTQHQKLTNAYTQFIENIKSKLAKVRSEEIERGTQDFIKSADRIINAQPNSILIYPLVLPDKVRILWATKGGALDQAECPLSEAQLSKLTEDFRTALQDSDDLNPVETTGKKLYNCLLPEKLRTVLKTNNIENLIFVPDRVTNYIPMAALHDGKQYLIENFTLSTILTTQTDTTDKLSPTLSENPVLGFGVTQAIGGFGALPAVQSELDSINKIFPGMKRFDQDFTEAALRENIGDHRILHIATHGSFTTNDPENSFLLLGNGKKLTIPAIESMKNLAGTHLVVLSACETGKGGMTTEGMEVAGLGHFFLRSGAKSVMASLWLVNDPATALLMRDFYTQLATGKVTKAEALRQTQLAFLKGDRTTDSFKDLDSRGVRLHIKGQLPHNSLAHPYYWAPFILIGNNL